MSWSAASRPRSTGRSSSNVARCPPASAPWTTSASAPAPRADQRLVGRRHRGPDGDAHVVEAAHLGARRAAERERHDGHAQLGHERELLLPAVVVVARGAGVRAQPARVRGDRLGVGDGLRRGEHVHAERLARQRAERGDVRRGPRPRSCSRRRGSRGRPPRSPRRRARGSRPRRPSAPERSGARVGRARSASRWCIVCPTAGRSSTAGTTSTPARPARTTSTPAG